MPILYSWLFLNSCFLKQTKQVLWLKAGSRYGLFKLHPVAATPLWGLGTWRARMMFGMYGACAGCECVTGTIWMNAGGGQSKVRGGPVTKNGGSGCVGRSLMSVRWWTLERGWCTFYAESGFNPEEKSRNSYKWRGLHINNKESRNKAFQHF